MHVHPFLAELLELVGLKDACIGPKMTFWPLKSQIGLHLDLSFVVGEPAGCRRRPLHTPRGLLQPCQLSPRQPADCR